LSVVGLPEVDVKAKRACPESAVAADPSAMTSVAAALAGSASPNPTERTVERRLCAER
jgi:hypothetical protein